MKKTFIIFAIIALLVANVSTARAEENFGFSIAGVQVSDENCDVIGKVLSWSNFLLWRGDIQSRHEHADARQCRYPFPLWQEWYKRRIHNFDYNTNK